MKLDDDLVGKLVVVLAGHKYLNRLGMIVKKEKYREAELYSVILSGLEEYPYFLDELQIIA